MAYFAQKPTSFGGEKFKIGGQIPDTLLLPSAISNLLRMGVITSVAGEEGASSDNIPEAEVIHQEETVYKELVPITVPAEEGELLLELTLSGLQSVFDILIGSVEAGEKIISEMVDKDALILLHITDSRKTIKKAAEERGKALAAEAGADNTAGGTVPDDENGNPPADDSDQEGKEDETDSSLGSSHDRKEE